jgi:hypothetical protein
MGGAGTFHIAQKSMDRWAAIGMYSAAFPFHNAGRSRKI